MSKKEILLFLVLCLSGRLGQAQKQDRIWCFGDHAGIDFNDTVHPVSFNSILGPNSMASYASIADNNGNLLFYAAGIDLTETGGKVYNKNNMLMDNGDSIANHPQVSQGLLIIPFPNDSNLFYLFSLRLQFSSGTIQLFYSIIDMHQNGGLGRVITKNVLLNNNNLWEKLTAVKHANGRDWWIVVLGWTPDTYYKYLVSPSGISTPFLQTIGSSPVSLMSPFGMMVFSKDGTKLVTVAHNSYIDLFDFDRCTGTLSNYRDLSDHIQDNDHEFFGCSFSPKGSKLYVSPWNTTKNIYQYDLDAPNIGASKYLVFNYPDTGNIQYVQFEGHQLAPDGKIYVAKGNGGGGINSDTYNTHHIDAILSPDSLGALCNYQSNYLDLGTGRTIEGLPNMPNYNLGAVTGSICDTVSAVNYIAENRPGVKVFPNPSAGLFSIRLDDINDRIVSVSMEDVLGNKLFSNKYFHYSLDITDKPAGVYFLQVLTEKGKLFSVKLIKR